MLISLSPFIHERKVRASSSRAGFHQPAVLGVFLNPGPSELHLAYSDIMS
jgi:hypothetical protein